MPTEEHFRKIGAFSEELVKAGILLNGDGLHPSRRGKRIRFAGGRTTVIDGPFAETKELVAGYWIWQVASMDEAVAWAQRYPVLTPGDEPELELRPVTATDRRTAGISPARRAISGSRSPRRSPSARA